MTCGCMKVNERHGDARMITLSDVQQAAAASNIAPREALKNMRKTIKALRDGKIGGSEAAWPTKQDGGDAKA